MFNPTHSRRAGIVLAVGFALAAVPVSAQGAPVDLGTASPFVVLGGSTVTNTGPSVLDGDLGLSPGTSVTGFPPGTLNGTLEVNNGVAGQAQSDLTTAYNVAAGQAPDVNLSGSDLGGLTLIAGTYKFDSAAGLTGALTLDAQGDPNAEFVFQIGSTLITGSSSSVVLINGASPCNVYWQVGSSATLGTGTSFEGNILANTSITLDTGTNAIGRMLARTAAVTLDTNRLTRPNCATSSPTPTPGTTPPDTAPGTTPGDTPPGSTPPGSTPPGTTSPSTPAAGTGSPTSPAGTPGIPASSGGAQNPAGTNQAPPASRSRVPTRNGTAILRPNSGPPRVSGSPRESCTAGFSASVRGTKIKRVVFSLDGKRIASRTGSPYQVTVKAPAGDHKVSARVTFKDATRAKNLTLNYRACAAAVLQPRTGPSQFTG